MDKRFLTKCAALLTAALLTATLLASCGKHNPLNSNVSYDESSIDRSDNMTSNISTPADPTESTSANGSKVNTPTTTTRKPNTPATPSISNDGKTVTVNVADYAGNGDDDDVLNYAIDSVVMMANADSSKKYVLKLEKKTYKLDGTLLINGGNNITIEGNGASLVWTELIRALLLRDCTNVTLQNFSMDYDPLPFTQGVVTSVRGTSVTVAIDKGYRTDITNVLPKGNGYMTIHDRSTGAPVEGAANFYYPKNARHTGGQNITFTLDWQDENAKKLAQGDVVCLFNRGEMTLEMSNCSQTTFNSVNMYSSPGFLFNEGYGEGGTVLKNCQIVPGAKPAGATQNRLRSSNADAAHFGNVKKGPTFDGCRVTHSGDDGLNVQGFFFHVVKVSGKTIWVTPKWDTGASVGETIEAYEKTSYAAFGTAKITGFERQHDSSLKEAIKNAYVGVAEGYQSEDLVYKITLDKALSFKVGDHITSLDRIGSGTTVKNSTFGYNTGRCIVVKGHDVVIENNTLAYSCNSAIYALADLNWCESGFPQNVRISGNKIENCNTSGVHLNSGRGDAGAIRLDILPTSNVSGFMNNYNNKNITVENNTITASRVYGIFATNCDGIRITGNTIDRPFVNGIAKVGQSYGLSPVGGLFVGMSKNITVTGNTVIGGGKISQAVEIYNNCTGSIQNSDNTLR